MSTNKMDATIRISVKEYEQLIEDSETLYKLEAAGVSSWDGYDFAMEEE